MKGLYVHIPFCLKKCDYCDFISFTNCEENHGKYVDSLIDEMKEYTGEEINSVFIGGGTPTILSPILLDRLLKNINENFKISDDCEFSIESNPATVTKEKLLVLRTHNVNRISVGVQSFNDDELKMIGRIHDSSSAYETINLIKENGFKNINIDIMSALPMQTIDKFMYSLKCAVECESTHISCYSLILEDNTPLEKRYSKGEFTIPDEELDREMYHNACDFLEKNGYIQYEISNFAKNGYKCRHNIKYWNCDEYIGVGIAAHSYIGNKRYYNTSNLSDYLNGKYHCDDVAILTQKDLLEEFMIMGLRMNKGISENEFKRRFGADIHEIYSSVLDKYIKMGFIIYQNGRYFLSKHGFDVSNSIMSEFMF